MTERTDSGRTVAITRGLLAFFDERRRALPWRRDAEPYRVWISEIMLQQTRVETVLPYYERWLRRFPDVAHLAAAPLDDVLREWQGLGYYSRARNLHAAARAVCERHDGRLPDSVDALRALPGIGDYTAGALASIAFGHPEPAIDGNARRVLSRLFDLARPTAATLREYARTVVPSDRPGAFNQAVMELGATLCVPRKPRCSRCPVRDVCLARIRGTVARRPPPRPRPAVPRFDVGTAAIVAPGGRLLLVRRPGSGLLAGLWSLPGAGTRTRESVRAAAARAGRLAGVRTRARDAHFLGAVEHAFSHRHETYHVHRFDVDSDADPGPDPDRAWADARTRAALALPAGQRRILRLVFP